MSRSVAAEFALGGAVDTFEPLGIGLINDTFVATVQGGGKYIVQRVNASVFDDIPGLMDNVARVVSHLHEKGARCPELINTNSGGIFHREPNKGDYWRVFEFMKGTAASVDLEDSVDLARHAGFAFGEFARLLSDLPEPPLNETLPDFHNTPKRFTNFVAAAELDSCGRANAANTEISLAMGRKNLASIIDPSRLPRRVVHNDAKIENVLFDALNGRAVCVVDLDTVMPGTGLHDFGDLVRTVVPTVGEDEPDLDGLEVSVEAFSRLAEGFMQGYGDVLTAEERELLPAAGAALSFEQALRFLTDHLLGDIYYRVQRPGQNLDRARNQLRLVELLEERRDDFAEICKSL